LKILRARLAATDEGGRAIVEARRCGNWPLLLANVVNCASAA